jgi:hypothetical protein
MMPQPTILPRKFDFSTSSETLWTHCFKYHLHRPASRFPLATWKISPDSLLALHWSSSLDQSAVCWVRTCKIGDQQALVSMSAAVATMMNVCCASSSGMQILQSAYGFPRTFLRLRSQRHTANVNSSRLVAVGRSVPARQLIIHSSISTAGVSLRSCFLTILFTSLL